MLSRRLVTLTSTITVNSFTTTVGGDNGHMVVKEFASAVVDADAGALLSVYACYGVSVLLTLTQTHSQRSSRDAILSVDSDGTKESCIKANSY